MSHKQGEEGANSDGNVAFHAGLLHRVNLEFTVYIWPAGELKKDPLM